MSSNDRNSPPLPSPNATDRRRSSFSAAGLADLFSRQSNTNSNQNPQPPAYPGPITSAAAQAQRRRLSLTTLGLSGAPNAAAIQSARARGESFSSTSSNANTVDESPFEEGDAAPPPSATSPFARRLSFGARALRDRQSGGGVGNTNGRSSTSKPSFSTPTNSSRGEGFNFADNMRSRAERTSSISGPAMPQSPARPMHERAKSVTIMEPPKEMPRAAPPPPKVPDAVQERMLRGDFYMD